MKLTIQVFDLTTGRPAADVDAHLYRQGIDGWDALGDARTDHGGHVDRWKDGKLPTGSYRIVLDTGRFYSTLGLIAGQGDLTVAFIARMAHAAYRVLVLIATFGYAAYTGVEI